MSAILDHRGHLPLTPVAVAHLQVPEMRRQKSMTMHVANSLDRTRGFGQVPLCSLCLRPMLVHVLAIHRLFHGVLSTERGHTLPLSYLDLLTPCGGCRSHVHPLISWRSTLAQRQVLFDNDSRYHGQHIYVDGYVYDLLCLRFDVHILELDGHGLHDDDGPISPLHGR